MSSSKLKYAILSDKEMVVLVASNGKHEFAKWYDRIDSIGRTLREFKQLAKTKL